MGLGLYPPLGLGLELGSGLGLGLGLYTPTRRLGRVRFWVRDIIYPPGGGKREIVHTRVHRVIPAVRVRARVTPAVRVGLGLYPPGGGGCQSVEDAIV